MRRIVSRSLLVAGFVLSTLIGSTVYADDCQQTPSVWQQIVEWVANRISLPPG